MTPGHSGIHLLMGRYQEGHCGHSCEHLGSIRTPDTADASTPALSAFLAGESSWSRQLLVMQPVMYRPSMLSLHAPPKGTRKGGPLP